MNIETQNLENHEVKINVALDNEEFAPYMAKAAKKIAGSQRIPGFRPGKAPANVIRNMFGEMAVAQEAFDIFMEEKYASILNEANVEPGAMGRLDNVETVNPPKFSIIVPLKAVVDLADYREVREDYVEEAVTDEEVEEALKQIKEPYASQEPVEDGEVEDSELVYVMIKGELDTPLEEGGSTEIVKEMPYQFLVGADKDPDSAWPYPEFTNVLIGHKVGDVVTSSYTYPENTAMSALRGKTATYTTTVQSIKKMVLPENDDDFAKNFGKETFADLLEELKKNLAEGKKHAEENKYIDAVLKKITDGSHIEYSNAELQDEINSKVNEIKESLQQRGIGFDAWLKMKKTDEASFIENEVKSEAIESLKRRLVLSEFAAKEKIHVSYEKYQEKAKEMMEYYGAQLKNIKNNKQRQQMISNISENALNEAYLSDVFGRMISIAKGENPAIEEEDPSEANAKAAAEAGEEAEENK